MHLGSRISALLDGRLPAAEEERAWQHVHACHPCRDLVEREGWVKTRLAGLSFADGGVPEGLKESLLAASTLPGADTSPLTPRPFAVSSTSGRGRHRSLAVIGGGAAGAAVVGVVGVIALGAAGTPQLDRRAPISDLSRPTQTSTPTVVDRTDNRSSRMAVHRRRGLAEHLDESLPSGLASHVVVVRDVHRVTMTP